MANRTAASNDRYVRRPNRYQLSRFRHAQVYALGMGSNGCGFRTAPVDFTRLPHSKCPHIASSGLLPYESRTTQLCREPKYRATGYPSRRSRRLDPPVPCMWSSHHRAQHRFFRRITNKGRMLGVCRRTKAPSKKLTGLVSHFDVRRPTILASQWRDALPGPAPALRRPSGIWPYRLLLLRLCLVCNNQQRRRSWPAAFDAHRCNDYPIVTNLLKAG